MTPGEAARSILDLVARRETRGLASTTPANATGPASLLEDFCDQGHQPWALVPRPELITGLVDEVCITFYKSLTTPPYAECVNTRLHRYVLTATLISAALAPALAQMNHGGHGTGNPATNSTRQTEMGDMNLARLKGKAFDRAFLSMMIAHHQGALDMSKAVVNTVKDPQVQKWTQEIIAVQQKEINEMTALLKPLGGLEKSMHAAMLKDMNGMLKVLKANKDADRALVEGMLPHHASAIDMANLALQYSDNTKVLNLSRAIIRTQADEMHAYKLWLFKR
ncbi:hypothetical protein Deipe_1684 [Deinococcus peraridilitoris DSM 19664]|uniref:DUF305 domain-containing protein n=1 Tax=Deinococcus peraridilitoris (strain DSM 19664 / LMG 22246 / CIP 109416 / KR-200) TaxID=937777 RepID=L0A220_DEIPD|nr:hypothetical protein Deipe_1684 [Deinococcus peraridilitoris DSM 19664]